MNLSIDDDFKAFLDEFQAGKYESPLQVPPRIWGSFAWELIDHKLSQEILLHFARWQVDRVRTAMPELYGKAYKQREITGRSIQTMDDFYRIPGLTKDTPGGIREKVRANPYVMMPKDVKKATFVFKSGGTKGVPTPTFITSLDREIESHGWSRGTKYEGIKQGDIALITYNPTHKGGEEMKENLEKVGVTCVLKRTNETAEDVIKIIQDYNINVLYTVQGPIVESDAQQKGSGVNLLNLIEAGGSVLEERIKVLFLGGYRLIPEVIAWTQNANIPLVTLLGSSEAIPQATNTAFSQNKSRLCKENNLHVLNGPHLIEVVKEESGVFVPAKTNEPGILVYTTVAREGTVYLRYCPGDSATVIKEHGTCACGLKSEVITDVGRIDFPDDVVETGCCIG